MNSKLIRNKISIQKPILIWFTGLPCSGKTTIALSLKRLLQSKGCQTIFLDGDILRNGLNSDLSFSESDREENLRRVAHISKVLIDQGIIVIASFVSPYNKQRNKIRNTVGDKKLFEIFVNTPLEECIKRDVKGMYAKAIRGDIKNFTGIDDPYQKPKNPFMEIDTMNNNIEECTLNIFEKLKSKF